MGCKMHLFFLVCKSSNYTLSIVKIGLAKMVRNRNMSELIGNLKERSDDSLQNERKLGFYF